jgi:hypothetical protein
MINNRAMPVLLSTRRVATHHRSPTPTVNDFAGALRGGVRRKVSCDLGWTILADGLPGQMVRRQGLEPRTR